jgi:hypothetical protein
MVESDSDPLLSQFIPEFDVREHRSIRIAAPPEVVLETASRMDLERPWIVRAIIRAREIVLGAKGGRHEHKGLIEFTQSLGWGMLAQVPGREIVMGAITQPWLADVVFRALPPPEFREFQQPDYVKIAWTLRADPVPEGSVFHTETRVIACDAESRAKFTSYWAKFSPGIRLIRLAILRPLKREAEALASLRRCP